jgi:hypothetical protein
MKMMKGWNTRGGTFEKGRQAGRKGGEQRKGTNEGSREGSDEYIQICADIHAQICIYTCIIYGRKDEILLLKCGKARLNKGLEARLGREVGQEGITACRLPAAGKFTTNQT